MSISILLKNTVLWFDWNVLRGLIFLNTQPLLVLLFRKAMETSESTAYLEEVVTSGRP